MHRASFMIFIMYEDHDDDLPWLVRDVRLRTTFMLCIELWPSIWSYHDAGHDCDACPTNSRYARQASRAWVTVLTATMAHGTQYRKMHSLFIFTLSRMMTTPYGKHVTVWNREETTYMLCASWVFTPPSSLDPLWRAPECGRRELVR